MSFKALRIVSDGRSSGTRIETTDGEPLNGVMSLSLSIEPGKLNEARMVVAPSAFEGVVRLVSITSDDGREAVATAAADGQAATEADAARYRALRACVSMVQLFAIGAHDVRAAVDLDTRIDDPANAYRLDAIVDSLVAARAARRTRGAP